jgi:guanylate kinase
MEKPRVGLVLSGLTGAGKTTVEALLESRLQMRRPTTLVTRRVDPSESPAYVFLSEAEFVSRCQRGDIAMPFRFGSAWYGYEKATWENILRSAGQGWVFNVRPYTGLILKSALSMVTTVWLELPEHTRQRRLRSRGAERDLQEARRLQDTEDRIYRPLYEHIVPSEDSDTAVSTITGIVRS